MFLNVVMMLLPLRGYRQGCHRSPTWTALPIIIGIVLGSHRHVLHYCFWTFFNGPSPLLTPGPSHLGLILILMSQHDEASVELDVLLRADVQSCI